MAWKGFDRVSVAATMAFLGASMVPGGLNAQAGCEIAPRSPVRLTLKGNPPSGGLLRIDGRLVRLDADSVVLTDRKLDHAAARGQVLRIETRSPRGRGGGALRGLGWGASMGAIAGAVAGWINPGDDPGGSALFGAVVLGSFGGGIGAAIGAAWPGERWVEHAETECGP